MNDGPLSTLSIPERRERLQAYDNAWKSLRWSTCKNVFNIPNHTYEMSIAPGGLLTFLSKRERKIIFVQIPSSLRDIPTQQWKLSLPFGPRACALDPSEDVLVVLQRHACYLQFLSLSTGKPHPLAAVSPLCDPLSVVRQITRVRIDVVQNHVAVLILDQQLRVWNWKTGQIMLDITPRNVQSFVFLSESRILLATAFADDFAAEAGPNVLGNCPALVMYNLDQASASQQQGAATPIAIFGLELGQEINTTYLALHYNGPDTHPYSREVTVPFFSAPEHHLIALHANGMLGATDDRPIILGHVLLIPMVKLTSHIGSTAAVGTPTRYIPWNKWGSLSTRRVPDPISQGYFQNALSGPRFIPRPHARDSIDLWDFSRASGALEQCDRGDLPCVQKQLALPSQITGRVVAMISEDAIVIRESCNAEQRVYLLFF
ncbi:hypothetical protein EI94DRAFT_1717987 [Lactarius quietus]|nr:hypothetical protein EI94DRAFT_1717987 [Lactarius quietus]